MNFKNKVVEQDYWNKFYEKCVIDVPSQFCVSMATNISNRKTIVEFGSGSGRDSLYLASIGHVVVAMDLSVEAVEKCNMLMKSQGVHHSDFLNGDMSNASNVHQAISIARSNAHYDESDLIVYSRFVMHTLDDNQEDLFLSSVSKSMKTSEVLCLEFRSKEDAETEKYFGNENHYRRYIDSGAFIDRLENNYNFEVEYNITGQGMARYKNEDPFVTRIVAVKK